jgi:hypothetical protein
MKLFAVEYLQRLGKKRLFLTTAAGSGTTGLNWTGSATSGVPWPRQVIVGSSRQRGVCGKEFLKVVAPAGWAFHAISGIGDEDFAGLSAVRTEVVK